MKTTQDVANRYYELAKQNKRREIVDELYADDIINREPEHAIAMGIPTITKGLNSVKAKTKARDELIETVHSETCSAPVIGGKFFSVALGRDITLKGRPRMNLQEIGVYEVNNGRIVSEQYFY
jgi:limonene-1,2-epoxide hydrolase